MPELPEVETIKLQLTKYLVGHKIVKLTVNNRKVFTGDEKIILGAKIKGVRRFAKVLSIDLDNNYSLVIHIKLTGQLIYKGPNLKGTHDLSKKVIGGVPGKHTHLIFGLDRGAVLYYNDLRRFGWVKLIKSDELETTGFIGKLGPEPLKDLTPEKFKEILLKSGRQIKVILMDQTKIGGVGNIYANDALWLAKINPKTPAKELKSDKITQLYDAILKVLKAGLKYGGASELMFVTPDGKEGEYQNHTLSYGHEGELCPRCKKAKFEKFFLGGRGTYVCSVCQRQY